MRFLVLVLFLVSVSCLAQPSDPDYDKLKADIVARFKNASPGKFGPFVKDVVEAIDTEQPLLALTFDACGGPNGNGYDKELIDWLREQKIQATLFIGGLWVDAHPDLVNDLAKDSLFEIENHGLRHRPCSINGRSMYGIHGTENVSQAVDEIELNARKLKQITHRKPVFYRSATATSDEACGRIAKALGERIISYDVLSGDAVAGTPAETITNTIVRKSRKGAIVIMHMNHPEWNGFEALKQAVPQLQKMGYSFVKLQHHSLKSK